MKEISENNFGVMIAFLVPGSLFLWGLSYSSDYIASLLAGSAEDHAPTVGGFLYATLASLAVGLFISAVRWVLIDRIHKWTGVPEPRLNFARLKDRDLHAAFAGAVENHYRYYQYYANTLVAVVGAFAVYVIAGKCPSGTVWVTTIAIIVVLFIASRDTLKKYHSRAIAILSEHQEEYCK